MAPKGAKRKREPSPDTDEKKAARRAATFDAKVQQLQIDLEAVECAVCTEAIAPPIMTCANSHISCEACASKCNSVCAQCRQPISQRNRALEKMVEKLVVPCAYRARGCAVSLLGATIKES